MLRVSNFSLDPVTEADRVFVWLPQVADTTERLSEAALLFSMGM